jgi:hypothetical protein
LKAHGSSAEVIKGKSTLTGFPKVEKENKET